MLEYQRCFSVKRMAVVLQISRSGYYDWRKNGSKLSNRALRQQSRDMKIRKSFDDSKGRYGAIRIQQDLEHSLTECPELLPGIIFKKTNFHKHSLPLYINSDDSTTCLLFYALLY